MKRGDGQTAESADLERLRCREDVVCVVGLVHLQDIWSDSQSLKVRAGRDPSREERRGQLLRTSKGKLTSTAFCRTRVELPKVEAVRPATEMSKACAEEAGSREGEVSVLRVSRRADTKRELPTPGVVPFHWMMFDCKNERVRPAAVSIPLSKRKRRGLVWQPENTRLPRTRRCVSPGRPTTELKKG